MQLTLEQQTAIEKAATGEGLTMGAYAGCGKTSTLKAITRALSERTFTYMAFNKSIAKSAQGEFGQNVACSTTHSLAARWAMPKYRNADKNKLFGSSNATFLCMQMGVRNMRARVEIDQFTQVTVRSYWGIVNQTVKRWCGSGANNIETWCVPKEGALGALEPAMFDNFAGMVVRDAKKLWEQMVDPTSKIPLGHDGYLKLWALSRPIIDGDCLLVDEAQDTNGVVLNIVRHQPQQVICVGDRHQQIYEWRGARNAMTELESTHQARLTTSWRFGEDVARYATGVLALLGETIPMRGNPSGQTRLATVEQPNAILCRSNATAIGEVQAALSAGKKPLLMGGTREIMTMVDAAEKLQAGQSVEWPIDFFGFKNWDEVREASEGPEGKELERWVQLIDREGIDSLRATLAKLPQDEEAAHDVVISTGHKAKGREWHNVRLTDDFLKGVKKDVEAADCADEELRLFYVAVTRCKETIDIPSVLTDKLAKIRTARTVKEAA